MHFAILKPRQSWCVCVCVCRRRQRMRRMLSHARILKCGNIYGGGKTWSMQRIKIKRRHPSALRWTVFFFVVAQQRALYISLFPLSQRVSCGRIRRAKDRSSILRSSSAPYIYLYGEATIDTRRNKLVLKLEHKILNMKGKACIANQGDNFMYNLSHFEIWAMSGSPAECIAFCSI